jgi:hypothetical protein
MITMNYVTAYGPLPHITEGMGQSAAVMTTMNSVTAFGPLPHTAEGMG